MRKIARRCCSFLLTFLMVFSTFTGFQVNVSAEAETAKVDDAVTVTLDGDDPIPLTMFAGGVYETGVSLEEGIHSYTLLINGIAKAENIELELTEPQEVYIRYYAHGSDDPSVENGVVDSINNSYHFKTAATWVGTLTSLPELNIDDWNPADADGDLDYLGGGRYKKTFTFSPLEEDTAIEYKVAYGHQWSNGEVGANVKLTIPKGATSVTIYADYLQGICTDSINEPEITIQQNNGDVTKPAFTSTIQLIGTVRGNDDDNWTSDADGWEFTQITKTLYAYSQVFDKGDYQYKIIFDKTNWYEKTGNRSLSIADDNTNVVFLYDAETQLLYDTVNDYNVIAEKLGFQSAQVVAKINDNPNGTTEFILPGNENDQISLTYAPKSDPEKTTTVAMKAGKDANGDFSGFFSSGDIYFGDSALDYIYYYTVNGEKTLIDSADKVTIEDNEYNEYTRDAFNGREVYVPGTLPGPSWDAASNQMTYLGNGLYSYTFEDVPPANYQYKIAIGGTWDENYGQYGIPQGSNIDLPIYSEQDVTIYYSDLSHLSVTSLNYTFADIDLSGTSIPTDTKMEDNMLTGIYTATVSMPAGSFDDIKITWNDRTGGAKTYDVSQFELSSAKDVTFYFDPSTELFYCNASDEKINDKDVYFNTRDTKYKSVYGAVKQNESVTFSIQTGNDVDHAYLFIQGPENKKIAMEKRPQTDGKILWTTKQSFSQIGEYTYYFALVNASDLKVYCDDDGYYGTGVLTDLNNNRPYDLVVYKEDYKTPDWMKNAIIYQIFPDRFCNGDQSNDKAQESSRGATNYEFITDWSKLPENPEQETLNPDTYPQNAYKGDGLWSNEIYGGDLKGITEKIDYLKKLGVNVIYLNPVFSSISSHRYDTSDYSKIDPILGTLGDFKELVETAKDNGMHIILDGVFNHVSDDSIYFDRYYKFIGVDGKVGAYPYWAYVYDYMADNPDATQQKAEDAAKDYFKSKGVTDFTYTKWFDIYQDQYLKDDNGEVVIDTIGDRTGKPVYGYDGWWGYDSMPVIKATDGSEYQTPGWADYIIDGENCITQYWLEQGSNGWRLDVANEVSDETWRRFRESVKSLNDDNVIIGEIWDDATKYLLGDMYDSVMNYQFRNAVLGFARGGDSADAAKTLEKIRERYPKEAFYAMMNLVDSHDTTRLLSYLDGIDDDRAQTDVANAFPSYEATSDEAKQKQRMVALIQMTYPGAPTIYYGDEVGMVGADDPDNRRAMDWSGKNQDLFDYYAKLTSIRNEYPALRTGSITQIDTQNSAVLAYSRSDQDHQFIIAANNSSESQKVSLKASDITSGTMKDLLTGQTVEAENGQVTVSVPAYSGVILLRENKRDDSSTHSGGSTHSSSSTHHSSSSSVSSSAVSSSAVNVSKSTDGIATVTVDCAPDTISTLFGGVSSLKITVPNNCETTAKALSSAQKHAKVHVALPDSEIISQINSQNVKSVHVALTLPSGIAYGTADNVDITLDVNKSILEAAEAAQKDVTVTIIDSLTNKTAYIWNLKGEDLAKSAADLKDLNLTLNTKTSTLDAGLTKAIGSSLKGVALTFAGNGELPSATNLKVYVADQGFKPGQQLYLYYYNPASLQLENVEYPTCKVDDNGYADITISQYSEYVLLPAQVKAAAHVTSDTGKNLTVKKGSTYQFKLTSAEKVDFVCGNGSVFSVTYVGKEGNNYFYKITAIGKVGDCAGLYINKEKVPRTIATIK